MMRKDFLEPGSREWNDFLAKTSHGSQHLPGYVALAARHVGGTPCAFWAAHDDCEILIPLVLRCVPPELDRNLGSCDASSPYGYPAPLIYPLTHWINQPAGEPPPQVLEQARALLSDFCRSCAERRILSVFVRMHPLLASPHSIFEEFGTLVRHSETVYVDLSQDEPALWKHLRATYQKQLRKLEKAGFQSSVDQTMPIGEFCRLYRESMTRLHADDFYFFSDQFFTELCRMLGDNIRFCCVFAPGGKLVAATLYLVTDGIVEAFLAGADEEYQSVSVGKLAYYRMMQYGREQGWRFLHMGGGVGSRDDSLLHCKKGFSHTSAPFFTWRLIADSEGYRACVARAAERNPGWEPDSQFFPLYRQGRATGIDGIHVG